MYLFQLRVRSRRQADHDPGYQPVDHRRVNDPGRDGDDVAGLIGPARAAAAPVIDTTAALVPP
jgi:hypothetical protein